MTFWPRPNMLRFPNRCRILKTTAAKGPFCTGVVMVSSSNDSLEFSMWGAYKDTLSLKLVTAINSMVVTK